MSADELQDEEHNIDWFYVDGYSVTTSGPTVQLTHINITQCLRTCMDYTDFACLSVTMFKVESPGVPICNLFSGDRGTGGLTLIAESGWEYWEKITGIVKL